MECREACGACCIAPLIARPFHGMPHGKAAGERCAHLDDKLRCRLFQDPRRPSFCADFAAERSVCGENRAQAMALLTDLEVLTLPGSAA